jgi:hypothetical protein
MGRPQKMTIGEVHEVGIRGLLVYCSDHKCSHSVEINKARPLQRSLFHAVMKMLQ